MPFEGLYEEQGWLTLQRGSPELSRTKRLRAEIECLLRLGPANTVEIFDHLNDRFKWGATMNQVGNILAKDNRFSKMGQKRGELRGSVYTVCVWGLAVLGMVTTA